MGVQGNWGAEVILRSPARAKAPSAGDVTPDDLSRQVVAALESLGFEVLIATGQSISIRGPKELFVRQMGADPAADLLSDSLPVPGPLRDKVEGIYVQIPPKYF